MNKKELIEAVSVESGSTKAVAKKSLESVILVISEALKVGDNICLSGFGTFSVAHRKARTGRNPLTGAGIDIKASKQPKFKAGKTLKDLINN